MAAEVCLRRMAGSTGCSGAFQVQSTKQVVSLEPFLHQIYPVCTPGATSPFEYYPHLRHTTHASLSLFRGPSPSPRLLSVKVINGSDGKVVHLGMSSEDTIAKSKVINGSFKSLKNGSLNASLKTLSHSKEFLHTFNVSVNGSDGKVVHLGVSSKDTIAKLRAQLYEEKPEWKDLNLAFNGKPVMDPQCMEDLGVKEGARFVTFRRVAGG